jgi:hypothetical protein
VLISSAFGDFEQPEFNQNLRKLVRFLFMVEVDSKKYRRIF